MSPRRVSCSVSLGCARLYELLDADSPVDRTDTQPVRARWEPVRDENSEQRRILGGSKVGSRAWGLAWVDTVMEPPSFEEEEAVKQDALLRVKMAEEAEAAEAAAAAAQKSAMAVTGPEISMTAAPTPSS